MGTFTIRSLLEAMSWKTLVKVSLISALVLAEASALTVILVEFSFWLANGVTMVAQYGPVEPATIAILVWLAGGGVVVWLLGERMRVTPVPQLAFALLAAPAVIWARLHITDCWGLFSEYCDFFSSAIWWGILIAFLPFGTYMTFRLILLVGKGVIPLSSVFRTVRLLAVMALALGLFWLGFRFFGMTEEFSATPSSGRDLLLFLGFEFFILTGVMALLYGVFSYMGGMPFRSGMKTFLRANRARIQGSSVEGLAITGPILAKSVQGVATTVLLYAAVIMAILAFYFWTAGYISDNPLLGFIALGLSLITSAGWWWTELWRNMKPIRDVLPSSIFAWLAPALGVVGWYVTGELNSFFLMLITIPVMIGAIYLAIEWFPKGIRKIYRRFTGRLTRGRMRCMEIRQFFALAQRIKQRLYRPEELRVWQVVISVGIWAAIWGLPRIARLSGDETVAETASSFTSLSVPELVAFVWAILALYPACRLGTIAGLQSLMKHRSPAPDSLISMLLTMISLLGLAPLTYPAVLFSTALAKALFEEPGLTLVVQFYFFPIVFPWIYSLLLTAWLIVVGDFRTSSRTAPAVG